MEMADIRSDTCAGDKWYEADKERKERLERIVRTSFVMCGYFHAKLILT